MVCSACNVNLVTYFSYQGLQYRFFISLVPVNYLVPIVEGGMDESFNRHWRPLPRGLCQPDYIYIGDGISYLEYHSLKLLISSDSKSVQQGTDYYHVKPQ